MRRSSTPTCTAPSRWPRWPTWPWPSWWRRTPSPWSNGGTWPRWPSTRARSVVTLDVPDPLAAPDAARPHRGGRGRLGGPGRRGGGRARDGPSGRRRDERRPVDGAIVAIETATETVGVAVRTAAGVEADFTLTGRRRHVETLTPALEHLLDQVDLAPEQIGVVAVDIGPGLFTGLRVGVAAAKGLAAVARPRCDRGDQPGDPDRGAAGVRCAGSCRLRRRPPRRGVRLGQRVGCLRGRQGGGRRRRALHARPSWPRRSACSEAAHRPRRRGRRAALRRRARGP